MTYSYSYLVTFAADLDDDCTALDDCTAAEIADDVSPCVVLDYRTQIIERELLIVHCTLDRPITLAAYFPHAILDADNADDARLLAMPALT